MRRSRDDPVHFEDLFQDRCIKHLGKNPISSKKKKACVEKEDLNKFLEKIFFLNHKKIPGRFAPVLDTSPRSLHGDRSATW